MVGNIELIICWLEGERDLNCALRSSFLILDTKRFDGTIRRKLFKLSLSVKSGAERYNSLSIESVLTLFKYLLHRFPNLSSEVLGLTFFPVILSRNKNNIPKTLSRLFGCRLGEDQIEDKLPKDENQLSYLYQHFISTRNKRSSYSFKTEQGYFQIRFISVDLVYYSCISSKVIKIIRHFSFGGANNYIAIILLSEYILFRFCPVGSLAPLHFICLFSFHKSPIKTYRLGRRLASIVGGAGTYYIHFHLYL